MLSSQLAAIQEKMPVAGLDRLAEHRPLAWIEEALASAGVASIRRRRLPAEQVVWLVIALALYRHQSMSEVLATLDLALPHEARPFVGKSATTQARQRVGQAPLSRLFEVTARAWCAQDADRHRWKGPSACNAIRTCMFEIAQGDSSAASRPSATLKLRLTNGSP